MTYPKDLSAPPGFIALVPEGHEIYSSEDFKKLNHVMSLIKEGNDDIFLWNMVEQDKVYDKFYCRITWGINNRAWRYIAQFGPGYSLDVEGIYLTIIEELKRYLDDDQ